MYQKLERYIDERISVSQAEKDIIFGHFHEKKYSKDEIILHHGSICSNIYFVNHGLLRFFYLNQQGIESTRIIIPEK